MTIMTLPQNYILCYFQIMDPQASPTTINLVLLMAGLVLIQTTVLIITLFLMRQQLESLNQKLQQLSDTTSHRFEFFHRILDVAETALGNLPDLEDATKQKLEIFTKTTQKIDQNVAQIISTLRSEMTNTSNLINTALNNFSRQTFRLHKFLVNPPILFSSLLKSLITTLKQKLSQKKRPSETGSKDSELFI